MSLPSGGVLLAVIGEEGDTISVQIQPQDDLESTVQKSVEKDERTDAAATGVLPVVATAFAAGQTAEICLTAPSIGPVVAAWLAPQRPETPATAAKSAEEARRKREEGLREYEELKRLMLLVTTGLVVTGTGAAGWVGGVDTAVAFAAGGAAAFVYLLRLQNRVDELPSADWTDNAKPPHITALEASGESNTMLDTPGSGTAVEGGSTDPETVNLVRSIGVRAALATVAIGSAVALLGGVGGGEGDGGALTGGLQALKIEPRQFAAGVLGFLSHKLALVLVALMSGSEHTDD
ncbi:unnamed protein product [Closterium sp. NIES-64]|nr:unnamed protein product [Closterium sp. NIES-64]